jgi:hypothetical protein
MASNPAQMKGRPAMNRPGLILSSLLVMLPLLSGCQMPDPSGKLPIPPVIDGRLSGGEWDGALEEIFAGGSTLFLAYSEGWLFIGIRMNPAVPFVVNAHMRRGDEITILHSSAALGTASYREAEAGWEQVRDFDWRCRDTSDSQPAQAERADFLQDEHWLASIVHRGDPGVMEYQIAWDGQPLQLALTLIRVDQPEIKIPWPVHLQDQAVLRPPGALPEHLRFTPEGWAWLRLTAAGDLVVDIPEP